MTAANEMFDSAFRSASDKAGVFEHDGETGYFYLCETKRGKYRKIVAHIWVLNGTSDFTVKDISIRWDSTESQVGLFIHGQLWAAFDTSTGEKYGGDYHVGDQPKIPPEITRTFETM